MQGSYLGTDLAFLQTRPQEESCHAPIPPEPCSPDLSKLKVTDDEEISPTRVQVSMLLLDSSVPD